MRALLTQLRLPLDPTPESAGRTLTIDGRPYAVLIARHRRARRYVLRLASDDTVRLTVPRGACIAAGLRFVERQGAWIARERRRRRDRAEPWRDGTTLWYRGERVILQVGATEVAWGGATLAAPAEPAGLREAVEAHLAALAKAELPPRARELADEHGLAVARVSVRNQRSRWGACSSRGVITLNWRLIQMPASVSDYVILHELMHLRQANHSRRFWREVDAVCGWWREAERWLKRHGRDVI